MKQKLTTIILIVTFSFTTITAPLVAFAQLPTYDVGLNASGQGGIPGTIKEYGLDTLAYGLSKTAGAKIANKVFNKANGGASGDSSQPSFIQNFSDYFSKLEMSKIDKFTTDLSISTNPFAGSLAKSLIFSARDLSNGKSALESFKLDKIVGANWKNFSTDAKQGGWDGLLALSDTVNTSLGSEIIGKKELEQAKQRAKDLEQLKLTSPGTTSQGKCTLDFKDYKNRTKAIMQSRQDLQFQDQAFSQGAVFYNDDGSVMTDDQVLQQTQQQQQQNINGSIGLAEDYGQCLNELIQNPVGTVIGGINKQLDSVSEGFSQGDEIGEILVGMLMNLVISFVQNGLSSLAADFNQQRSDVGGPEQLVATNGQVVPWTSTPNTIIDMATEFEPALEQTRTEVANLRKYIELVSDTGNGRSFASVITELDQCVPGPDYGYKKRLDSYISKQTKRLISKKEKGKGDRPLAKQNIIDNIEVSVDSAKAYTDLAANDPTRNIPGADAMLARVSFVENLKQDYQQNKTELTKKQVTLSLLTSIETALQGNIQSLQTYFPGMPTILPFTKSTYTDRLTATQKTAAVTWAKNINTIPSGVPLTSSEWNRLTAAQKTAAVTWARDVKKQEKKPGMTDKDFVLATVWLTLGIKPDTDESTIERNFVISTVWNVWTNPELFMQTPWDTDGPVAKNFLTAKNKIRTDFNNLQNDVSNVYSTTKTKKSLDQMKTTVDSAINLSDDCKTIRDIASANVFTGPDAHTKLKNVYIANINRFKTDEVKNAIKSGSSILSQPPILTPAEFEARYNIKCDRINPTRCFDGSDLINVFDGVDDNEVPLNDTDRKIYTVFQVDPATDIWSLLNSQHDGVDYAFCGLNGFLKYYEWRNPLFPTPLGQIPAYVGSDGASIQCDAEWMKVKTTDIRSIIMSGF